MNFQFQWNVGPYDEEVTIDVEDYEPSTPPSGMSGPPENYDPGCAGECSFTIYRADGSEYTGLSNKELDSIESIIIEKAEAMLEHAASWGYDGD
jgi:hypothetical protein